MPVFYALRSIPHIGDTLRTISVSNAFCTLRFESGLSLQLETIEQRNVNPGEIVIGYKISEPDGLFIILEHPDKKRYTEVKKIHPFMYCQLNDEFNKQIEFRMVDHNRLNKLDILI